MDVLLAIKSIFMRSMIQRDHWAARTVNRIEEFAMFRNLPMPALD